MIEPGATIAEITTGDPRVVIESRLSPALLDRVRPGSLVKVWLGQQDVHDGAWQPARVAWVSPDAITDRRTGLDFLQARIVLDAPRSELPRGLPLTAGQPAEILILSGKRSLLDHLLSPVLRNLSPGPRASGA